MNHFNCNPATLIFLLSFLLMGCAPNSIYRSNYTDCRVTPSTDCATHSLQEYTRQADQSDYLLGFVEIDDQGQLRDRKQMQALIDKLYTIAQKDSLLINVFVHGWHHSAAPGDSNIEGFKQVLARISQAENSKKNTVRRKVVGVYVGWRGDSITIPVVNGVTFWDRKNTAQEIGYLGVTELLLKLEEVANIKNATEPPIKSRLVTIGHSFGGAALYSATSQILMSRFINSQPNKNYVGSAQGFGDLVVLLNPAFEALRYAPAFDLSQSRCSFFQDQTPKLAILTSESDNATGIAFPLGRTVNTVFETHSEIKRDNCGHSTTLDEGAADRNAVGHYLPLVSHTLKPLDSGQAEHEVKRAGLKNMWGKQTAGGTTQFGKTLLTHLNKTVPNSPYLNIRVDPALMDGHNDIFRPEVDGFIDLLIQMSTVD